MNKLQLLMQITLNIWLKLELQIRGHRFLQKQMHISVRWKS